LIEFDNGVTKKVDECLLVLVVGFYLFMNYVLLSQISHVEFFLAHMLSLGVTLLLPSLEMATQFTGVCHLLIKINTENKQRF
jgi:inner membrane protein involved in colicin E2 resistance